MVIFFPFTPQPTGGSSTFATQFKQHFEAKGHAVSFTRPKRYDLLFVSPTCPPHHLIHAKLTGKPIIHRLDGVYYPMSIAGTRWRQANFPLQLIHHLFATTTIYQSQYSRKSCDRFLGTNHFIPHQVIHNGVDTNHFSPNSPAVKTDNLQLATCNFVTASRFRRHDQITPLLKAFQLYRQRYNKNAHLTVIGNFEGKVANVPHQTTHTTNVTFLGPVSRQNLPQHLRTAHAFLHTHLNPPCPNNILEAMACGLPICGVADGAMSELTEPGTNSELIPAPADGYFTPRQLDLNQFAANLNKIMSNHHHYATNSRRITLEQFSLDHMIDRYLTAIEKVTNR